MRITLALLCVLALACLAISDDGAPLNPDGEGWELAGAIVARVDGEALGLSDLDSELTISKFLTQDVGSERSRRSVVDGIIKKRLLVSEAEKLRLEADRAEVVELLGVLFVNAGGEEPFWSEMSTASVAESYVFKWVRELILMRKYLKLRRQTTFVSESELVAFYGANREAFNFQPLSEVHEKVRDYLADKKHKKHLSQWMDKQAKAGRVRVVQFSKGELR
jgi:hypothetical protein